MYDENHRFIEVADVRKQIVRQGQKGWWEKLLCAACETRLNRYERHVRRMFTDPLGPPLFENRAYDFPNVEYRLLKLFILSVLWRASVSTLSECRYVTLGPYEEELRELIMNDATVDPGEFGCMLWVLFDGERHLVDMMPEPTSHREGRLRCYRFVMRGFVFWIYVGRHEPPGSMGRLLLGRQPAIRGYRADWSEFGFLREVITAAAAIP